MIINTSCVTLRVNILWDKDSRILSSQAQEAFSLLRIISDGNCESGITEVRVKSVLLLFFAGISGLLCFPPQLTSAVCFERKSI